MEGLYPSLFVVVVVVLTQALKILEQRIIGFSEGMKDIVYYVLAGVFVALAKFLGLVDLDWSVLIPMLFAPQGLFVGIKKLFQR